MAPAVEASSENYEPYSPSSPSSPSSEMCHPSSWKHSRASLFGRRLSIASFEGEKFLIGVQIAALLKRETFNMYRSMKIKSVDIQRATPQQVEFLARANAVRAGTHSVTLIPYADGLYFVADAWVKQHKSEALGFNSKGKFQRSFIVERPKLHRRKPHPWDVHRAIKKHEAGDATILADFSSSLSSSSSSSSYSLPSSPTSPTDLLTAAAASIEASCGSLLPCQIYGLEALQALVSPQLMHQQQQQQFYCR